MFSERHNKFNRLYQKRLDNCIQAIKSLAKLSNKGNYSYEDEVVTEIYQKLMFTVKTELSKFGSSNVEERYKRLLKADIYELAEIKQTDKDLYDHIQSQGFKNLDEAVHFVYEEQNKDSAEEANLEEHLSDLSRYLESIRYEARETRRRYSNIDKKLEKVLIEFGLKE
jgi:hypothetical protein